MHRFFLVLVFSCLSFSVDCAMQAKSTIEQTPQIREMCKKAQDLEQSLSKLSVQLDDINRKAKTSAPVVRNVYEILTRCYTVLFNMQRFSKFLILSQADNKNDFVRGSIVMKNFVSYFNSIRTELGKVGEEISVLKQTKFRCENDLKTRRAEYEELCSEISRKAAEIAKLREENVIQNDVVCHLAAKSESIEELDAELEAENAVGVLKNTKVSTELSIAYPVSGKIVTEFGDKGPNNEMIYSLTFETCPGAIVTSPAKGVVVFAGKFLNYGNMLIISNGEYRLFLYGMSVLFTSTGDVIEIGDYVGRMGESAVGNPRIQMELKKSGEPIDPRHWLLQTIEQGKTQ